MFQTQSFSITTKTKSFVSNIIFQWLVICFKLPRNRLFSPIISQPISTLESPGQCLWPRHADHRECLAHQGSGPPPAAAALPAVNRCHGDTPQQQSKGLLALWRRLQTAWSVPLLRMGLFLWHPLVDLVQVKATNSTRLCFTAPQVNLVTS